MVHTTSPTIEVIAVLLARHYRGAFKDGLVMRIGEGWEVNNAEAIASWIQARYECQRLYIDLGEEQDPFSRDVTIAIGLEQEKLTEVLRSQSEQVWERLSCPSPKGHSFLPQRALTADECRKMAHALLELLATWQAPQSLEADCARGLPGGGGGVRKLTDWIEQQGALYTHHPSELTNPLAHELVRILYPDCVPD